MLQSPRCVCPAPSVRLGKNLVGWHIRRCNVSNASRGKNAIALICAATLTCADSKTFYALTGFWGNDRVLY